MCGLCGFLEAWTHWTDVARAGSGPARQARLRRVLLANRVLSFYRLELADWQGTRYLLRNRTGATALVDHLGALWPAAEALLKRPCDPLDPELLAELQRSTSTGHT